MVIFSLRTRVDCCVLVFSFLVFISCKDHDTNGPPKMTHANEQDFMDTANVAIQLTEGFEISLWAPGPLLANAVAISLDNQGAAYISQTQRRKSSDIDIRQHQDWMTEDLGLQSLEDTRNFHLTKLATENSEENKWLEDFDGNGLHDWRDLTVQSERILKIWDSDGDGKADVSVQYADGFNDMLTGVAAGVLYHDEDVYLTAAPDVYRLRDQDGDGDADEREVISHGFGIHIAYAGHDMSGLVVGPDGKVYWSVGDIGVNAMDKNGKYFAYPNQGAVMRCNPDGTEFEVFAHGLRNPQELAFDAYGNLISVDNDGDHPGEHERFVHILEGSDSGWRTYWQFGKYEQRNEAYKVWMDEKLHLPHFKGQAAYLLPALALAPDGPAGLVYQPGTALNKQWNNFFFGSYFKGSSARSQIQAFRLESKGASFIVAESRDILNGIVSTGLAFGPEGALYINDWLETYDKKSVGRIWKLEVVDKDQTQREQTQTLLQQGMKQKSDSELELLLGHEDMRVRLNAQFELVKRGRKNNFLSALNQQDDEFANIHAVWGLGQLLRSGKIDGKGLLPFFQHSNPEVRAQTSKVIGDARYQPAADDLLSLMQDGSDRVKFFATEALGKIKEPSAFPVLVGLLEEIGDSDPHLRHGLIYALSRLGMEAEIAELAGHSSVHVKLGAVVALRNMRSPELSRFLQDKDTLVMEETARAIHDDLSVPEALPLLAESLLSSKIASEAFVRRAINANLRIGDPASARRLATYAIASRAPEGMRIDALWALGYWSNPPILDRVEGRYRVLPDRDLIEAQQAFEDIALILLDSDIPGIRAAALEAIGRLRYAGAENKLVSYCLQSSQPLEVRRASLRSLADLQSSSMEDVLTDLLNDDHLQLRTDAQALIVSVGLPPAVVVEMLGKIIANASTPEKQKAIHSLAKIDDPSAEVLLGQLLEQLIKGESDAAVQLDIMMAVENHPSHHLKEQLADYESTRVNKVPLERYQETLNGGNLTDGRQVFFNDNSAQCIRCHKLGDFGGDVGPNLEGIASVLDRKSLLLAMIDPSHRLAPGYGTVSLELTNGEKIVGVIEDESPGSVQLKTSDGNSSSFIASKIQSKTYFPSSMPSMEGVLSKEEIRDLMAFLSEQL